MVTTIVTKLLEEAGNGFIKFARWQHPAMRRPARFA